jgi:hypothetical protein
MKLSQIIAEIERLLGQEGTNWQLTEERERLVARELFVACAGTMSPDEVRQLVRLAHRFLMG